MDLIETLKKKGISMNGENVQIHLKAGEEYIIPHGTLMSTPGNGQERCIINARDIPGMRNGSKSIGEIVIQYIRTIYNGNRHAKELKKQFPNHHVYIPETDEQITYGHGMLRQIAGKECFFGDMEGYQRYDI